MSSRDVGPALPPHMRRSHGNTLEDAGSSSYRTQDEERSRHKWDDRRKHREKYDDRDRLRDSDRDRYNREKYRDRASYYTSERDHVRAKGKREEEERTRPSSGRAGQAEKQRHEGSSKRNKRSKTDRTYNTDTEESSDDSCSDNQKWTKEPDSDCEPESETSELEPESSKSPKTDEVSPHKGPKISDSSQIGPALPPHLFDQTRTKSLNSDSSDSETSKPTRGKESLTQNIEIGPALPPHLRNQIPINKTNDDDDNVGPALPPHLRKNVKINEDSDENADRIGPALPPNLCAKVEIDEEDSDNDDSIGPALPPQLLNQERNIKVVPPSPSHKMSSNQIGPALPPHLKKDQGSDSETELKSVGPVLPPKLKERSALGPVLPPGMDLDLLDEKMSNASSDDEVVGPLLPEEMIKSGKNYNVQAQLERNAAAIKRKMEEKDLPDVSTRREEWMLELPPEGTVDLGLGPRSFRARGAPEKGADRSMWTDTPADKARKEEEAKRRFELGISTTEDVKKAGISKQMSSKDKSMETIVKKQKRSKESLLDAHQKKIKEEKKKKEKAGAKQERRPFNRETDLKVNVFDDAQKKAIYKKAQLLDSRFSRGETKYL